jgi:hypothetical protein
MSLTGSLHSAARLAIAHENRPGAINMQRWAATYRCTVDDVIEAFKIAENGSRKLPEEIAATVPTITDDMMEGK